MVSEESLYSFEDKANLKQSLADKIENPRENLYQKRSSPKLSREAFPKSLLSDPEISRIASIMKGSK